MLRRTNDVDRMVGARIGLRRKEMGMTQPALASQLGITFQQVQKYEKGTNRIGAGRLEEIAKVLAVPVTYLFNHDEASSVEPSTALALLSEHGAFELLSAYSQIGDQHLRRAVLELARTLARRSVDQSNVKD